MIELEQYISIPPADAWEYLTQPNHIEKWWDAHATLQPWKKGAFTCTWDDGTEARGFITAFDAGKRLQMDYKEPALQQETRVEFLFSPEDAGTRLYFQHSGWNALTDEKLRNAVVDEKTKAWENVLKRFARYCAEHI
ncbi:MAG: SRPBCC domain-containing protein [Alphaproteobacteria bacterium]|nr:SRPBCC domain-containing protein [Alphaproteobacteria bacterium]